MTEPRVLITTENDSTQRSLELTAFGCVLIALSVGAFFWHLLLALGLSEQIRDGRS